MNNLPQEALRILIDIASSNLNDQGNHVETLAFLLAIKEDVNIYTITDIILPTQTSSGVFVEDHIVNNQDSAAFLHNLCNQVPTKFVIGWIHTHVHDTLLVLSAVDCHTLFLYETAVFNGIKAFVLHLSSRSLECYQLTETGFHFISS